MSHQHADLSVEDVDAAVEAALEVLHRLDREDWSRPAGDVTWTCRAVLGHVIEDLLNYAAQLATGAYLPLVVSLDDAETTLAVQALHAAARLLIAVLRTAPPGATGWHSYGTADAEATAAMGVVKLPVHTHDICQGLGIAWRGPRQPSTAALRRLFPDVAGTLARRTRGRRCCGPSVASSWLATHDAPTGAGTTSAPDHRGGPRSTISRRRRSNSSRPRSSTGASSTRRPARSTSRVKQWAGIGARGSSSSVALVWTSWGRFQGTRTAH